MNCVRYRSWIAFMILVAVVFAITGFEVVHSTGQVGATKKNGFGCLCHGGTPTDSVLVWISGSGSMPLGAQAHFSITMKGGPSIAGGFNIACAHGTLSTADASSQLLPYDASFELTHVIPKPFQNDTVSWDFIYHAPVAGNADTIFSIGNSVNFDGDPRNGDTWNYGNNFVVNLHRDTSLDVEELKEPSKFQLYQNYPNPFNPLTLIRFQLSEQSRAVLKVYNISGEEIATLFNRIVQAGTHEVKWDAAGQGYASGMYFYRLEYGASAITRKMVLIR